ncbi:MAG: hypothetical protein P1U58_17755 [Verrucomicrobiales bacterium]|nr:hypothetical protein [Verrucomicrobiales bacterium]
MFKKLLNWLSEIRKDPSSPSSMGGIFGKMTPESLCGIDPSEMDREEIKEALAQLYKRHNQAAGSLNPELREEAEQMLDAIVHCREKYVDSAAP